MLNKDGYTLIESLLVLFIISMLLLIFPFMSFQNKSSLNIQMNTIHAFLLRMQSFAMKDKHNITVNISGNTISSEQSSLELVKGISCNSSSVVFHPNGNVQRAQTIQCTFKDTQKDLVVLLGSGRMYVK